ncbi:hypothetical protein M408DRAFT_328969 [Serendipita vermifera MAFF 305830]|uniref:Acyl-CoA dehydrogenase/oxidase C-terminal domain-containing protein n=1 Tax=Serendipita vermifera MAFF 305830 TaxID=933852 RepID=A0A0C2WT53_SERVB|nr:hypothetical protein M408DRAFT_30499 [Serendipita vermifera MAFF 305830]KIM29328.1 hypothetical protein M408DRAFT_328969 [Serendipita vermifera MAFF 305830]
MRVEEGFQQPIPELPSGYTDDILLPSLLKRLIPKEIQEPILKDLERFGNDLNGNIRSIGSLADAPPTLTQYSHWGKRVDTLHTSEGWRRLKALSAEEGIVTISYERLYGEWSRIYAFCKVLILTGEGRVIGCPTSMTDGCARVLELLGNNEMRRDIMPRLTSRDPNYAFTAGQFMTERPGGSDVSLTETVAHPVNADQRDFTGARYRLNGFKWFSSATDSQVALALARTGDLNQGSRGLSLFLLPLRLPLPDKHTPTPSGVLPRTDDLVNGERINNGIEIHRLKSKIGTHAVPTAELSLNDSLAYLVGPLNGGVKAISSVLQLTRIHSAFHSIGSLARCFGIARNFSRVRRIDSGRRALEDVPLHVSTLAKVAVTYRAMLSFALSTTHLLGKIEAASLNSESMESIQARFRLLNPTLKAFATHHCVPAMEECMAALGGQGYMEETGIGRLIRDASVERIWEGTENVLALDLVRAAVKGGHSTLDRWLQWANSIVAQGERIDSPEFLDFRESVLLVKETVGGMSSAFKDATNDELLPHAMLLLFGHTNAALSMLEHAIWAAANQEPDSSIHMDAFSRWVQEGGVVGVGLVGLNVAFQKAKQGGSARIANDKSIVFGLSQASKEKSRL